MSNRRFAMIRSYALGNRGKGKCCICGQEIHNRMHYASIEGRPAAADYAHQKCTKQQPNRDWTRGW